MQFQGRLYWVETGLILRRTQSENKQTQLRRSIGSPSKFEQTSEASERNKVAFLLQKTCDVVLLKFKEARAQPLLLSNRGHSEDGRSERSTSLGACQELKGRVRQMETSLAVSPPYSLSFQTRKTAYHQHPLLCVPSTK
jgi:hypothetical protein